MIRRKNILLVANQATSHLARSVAAHLNIPFTEMQRKQFADGEIYHAFPCDVSGRDMVIVAATADDTAHQELVDLIAGCRYWNCRTVNVVIPYLGYSTMERAKPDSGEIPKGITRTRQIFRARPDYVAFIDLHSEAVLHAHAGEVKTMNLWTDRLAVQKIKDIGVENYVLVSPDYGFSKRVARLAGPARLPPHRGQQGPLRCGQDHCRPVVQRGARPAGDHLRRHDPHRRLHAPDRGPLL